MRSRIHGRGIGANTFSSAPAPSCPAGQHWEEPAAAAIRGISACVQNKVALIRLRQAPAPAPAPAPVMLIAPSVREILTIPPAPAPAAVTAPAPNAPAALTRAPAPTATCPAVWPWWWMLVAAAAGAGVGIYAGKDKKRAKKNAARMAHAVGGRLVNAGAARLFA